MSTTKYTLDYYNQHAEDFITGTVDVEFSALQNEFLSFIPQKGKILDLGCGSGRDSKVFWDAGFAVTSVDGSSELCKLASEYIGREVVCSTFQDYTPSGMFDGIWACASLLHLEKDDILSVISKLTNSLNQNGCFYVSFKYGDFSGERNGRFFTDMNEQSLADLLANVPTLSVAKEMITTDVRPGRSNEKWLNAFLIKKAESNEQQ